MKKYYIYLNGQQYMEIPKSYNIKQNVYMNYNDLINRTLKDRGIYGTANWNKKIHILSKIITNAAFTDDIILHELKHVEQMSDPKFQEKYIQATNLLGYMENPYEIEARQWGEKYLPLHRIGEFDIYHQKALQKHQRDEPVLFTSMAQWEKDPTGHNLRYKEYQTQKRISEQNLKTAIKQVQKHGGEPKMLTREQEWQKDISKRKAIELIRTRLEKFMK